MLPVAVTSPHQKMQSAENKKGWCLYGIFGIKQEIHLQILQREQKRSNKSQGWHFV